MAGWNYLGVISLSNNTSRAEVFKYQSRLINLPEVISGKSLQQEFGLRGNYTAKDVTDPLLSHISAEVPESEWHRTPVFLYATDSKSPDALKPHYEFAKSNSKLLVADPDVVDGHYRAALSWAGILAQRSNHNSKNQPVDRFGVVELSDSDVVLAYPEGMRKEEEDSDGEGEELDLELQTRKDHLKAELSTLSYPYVEIFDTRGLAACVPAAGGSYKRCKASIEPIVHNISAHLPQTGQLVVTGGEHKRDRDSGSNSKIDLCEDRTIASTECLMYVFAEEFAGLAIDGKNGLKVDTSSLSWRDGRAMLFADVELARNRGNLGIKKDSDKSWAFGEKDTVERPGGSDSSGGGSHRLLGSLILLVGLAGIIFLLIGAERRRKLKSLFVRRNRWQKLQADDDMVVELDDMETGGSDGLEDYEV